MTTPIRIGGTSWFEYHCDPDSVEDRPIYLRSHERVTILSERLSADGSSLNWPRNAYEQRSEAGAPRVYRVRFQDGLEWDACEDELRHPDPLDFCQPIPSSKALALRRTIQRRMRNGVTYSSTAS